MKTACKRYFSSISTGNDSSSSFFTTSALKRTSEVNKAHYNELREENTFFYFSVKDLVNFSKNSNDTGPHRSRKFTCYFSRKKRFMQHPQFLLHKRHLREHFRQANFLEKGQM